MTSSGRKKEAVLSSATGASGVFIFLSDSANRQILLRNEKFTKTRRFPRRKVAACEAFPPRIQLARLSPESSRDPKPQSSRDLSGAAGPRETSYFLSLGSGARLELMASPGEAPRVAHIAIPVGSCEAVDCLIEEMRAAGVPIVSGPRLTGDVR